MRIVINHVTRMRPPVICIAGVNPETLKHVRPVSSAEAPLTRDLLVENGGPIEIGALVDLGETRPCGSRPEIEDHAIRIDSARMVRKLAHGEFTDLLERVSSASMRGIFGAELQPIGDNTYATPEGRGDRSLGVMRTRRWARFDIFAGRGTEKLRLATKSFGEREWDRIPVTDASFFEPDQSTIRRSAVDAANERLGQRDTFFLMLGLSRPWNRGGVADEPERHWLQVNGVVFA